MKSFNEFRENQLQEGSENLSGKATHILNKDVRHPDHGIVQNGTVLRKTGEGKYEIRAGRAKGRIVGLDSAHVNKLDEEVDLEEGTVPAERNRPEMSASDKSKMGKVADLMAKEKAKKDLPFTPDKPHAPVAKAGKYGSGYSTARHLARQGMKDVQKEEVEQIEESSDAHKVMVTVSDPQHTMVSQRKEQIMKHVIVRAGDKGEAQAKAEAFYKKKGYKVHGSEYHSKQPATSMKTEEVELEEAAKTPAQKMDFKRMMAGAISRKEYNAKYPKATDPSKKLDKTGVYKNLIKTEETEQIDELSKKTLGSYVKKASSQAVTAGIVGTSMGAGHKPKANQPEPGSKQYALMRKREAGVNKAVDKLTKEETEMSQMDQYLAAISGNADFRSTLEEKKLTPAELKKREEIAQAMERENPGIDKSKKMAIATAQAKKVAEGADDWKPEKETGEPDAKADKELKDKAKKNTDDLQKISNAFAKEGKEHTVPKTEKEKDLAALAEPKNKITHADVLKGRGVTKEEAEQVEEAKKCMDEEGNPTGIKIYHTTKDGKSTHGIVFTPHDARTYEKEVKQSGGKVTHRAVMYGKKEGDKVAVKEGVEITEETLDELSKSTLSNYISKSALDIYGKGMEKATHRSPQKARAAVKRIIGVQKAAKKLSSEETDLEEAMISYNDFMDKIAMHRKMGNKVVDDKYSDKHATYTSINKDGEGKKITHTPSGTKQEHLGKVNGDDDEAAEVKTEKRGRGRPAGTKSGARRHS